jgi:ankyrin repeat protein
MATTTVVQKAQEVHAQLATIDCLYAGFLEALEQTETETETEFPLTFSAKYYESFAEKTYVDAKLALETEAERLDRILQGLEQEHEHDNNAEADEQKTLPSWLLTPHGRLVKLLEILSDIKNVIAKLENHVIRTYCEIHGCEEIEIDMSKITSTCILDLTFLMRNNLPIVYFLLQDSRFDPMTGIECASRNGYTDIVRLLLDARRDNNNVEKMNLALQEASRSGHTNIVKMFLDESKTDIRIDPSLRNNYAFRWACENGHIEVVRMLLTDERVDPTDFNNYAIRLASCFGHTEVVRTLLTDERVDPTTNNNHAIRSASARGHTDVVRLLLQWSYETEENRRWGVDPTAGYNEAILLASQNGYIEVVRLLIADPRVGPTAKTNYAILAACEFGRTEVVRLLLADPQVDPTANNNYAIRFASQNGHTEVVRLLLQYPQVDPTAQSNYTIRYASQNGHTEVVRMLLGWSSGTKCVDPTAESNSAIRLASENGHTEIVAMLRQNPRCTLE